MNKLNMPVPLSTENVTINFPKLPAAALRDPNLIEVGGGVIPGFKCTRENLPYTVAAIGSVLVLFFTAKHGIPRLFHKKEVVPPGDNTGTSGNPPKVESIISCVNNAGTPKKVLIPNFIVEGGLSVFGGREGAGKTLLGHQCAIELARGYGNLVAEGISPQNVLIIDGELDDDDYVERFGNMEIPSNITRVSDCDFANLKQLAAYIKDIVSGLLAPMTIFIDNLVALSLENLTGKSVNEFFRELKKIQSESKQTITFVIVDHIGKAPEGQVLDNSLLAGSANLARFAHNVAIIDKSARGADYRYIKFTKQRKAALPGEVLEVVISDDEYLHFEVTGTASEADVLNTKTNRKRFGQVVEGDEEEDGNTTEEDGRGRLWTDEDTERLAELASTLETPDKETIGLMMDRHPNLIYRKAKLLGIQLMTKPRGRKPKENSEQ